MLEKAPNKKLADLLDRFGKALDAGDIDDGRQPVSRRTATGAIS